MVSQTVLLYIYNRPRFSVLCIYISPASSSWISDTNKQKQLEENSWKQNARVPGDHNLEGGRKRSSNVSFVTLVLLSRGVTWQEIPPAVRGGWFHCRWFNSCMLSGATASRWCWSKRRFNNRPEREREARWFSFAYFISHSHLYTVPVTLCLLYFLSTPRPLPLSLSHMSLNSVSWHLSYRYPPRLATKTFLTRIHIRLSKKNVLEFIYSFI